MSFSAQDEVDRGQLESTGSGELGHGPGSFSPGSRSRIRPRGRRRSSGYRGDDRPYPERCDPFGDSSSAHRRAALAGHAIPADGADLAKRYRFRRIGESEELESTAYMALVEAAQTFDPQRKVGFATYARHRIRGALRDYQRLLLSAGWRGNRARRPVFQTLGNEAEQHGRVLGIAPDRPVGTLIEATEAVEHWLRGCPGSMRSPAGSSTSTARARTKSRPQWAVPGLFCPGCTERLFHG